MSGLGLLGRDPTGDLPLMYILKSVERRRMVMAGRDPRKGAAEKRPNTVLGADMKV